MSTRSELPPGLKPRLLTREQVLAYLQIGAATLQRYMDDGLIPRALPGTQRWDLHAIDRYLDRASGLLPESDNTTLALDRAFGLAPRA